MDKRIRKPLNIKRQYSPLFNKLEALGEHLEAVGYALSVEPRTPLSDATPGTPEYHLRAAEEYRQELWNELAAAAPDEYAKY